MLLAGAAVVAVWATLLGVAALARGVLGLGRLPSLALLAATYLAFCGLAFEFLGRNSRGLLGAAGMLVPLAVAATLVVRVPK